MITSVLCTSNNIDVIIITSPQNQLNLQTQTQKSEEAGAHNR